MRIVGQRVNRKRHVEGEFTGAGFEPKANPHGEVEQAQSDEGNIRPAGAAQR